MKQEEKASSLFQRDLFKGPVCSSFKVEFSEQVVRLVIVIKDPNFDHITAIDKLSTFNHFILEQTTLISQHHNFPNWEKE